MNCVIETKIGKIEICEEAGAITAISLNSRKRPAAGGSPLLSEAARQILEYLGGKRKVFALPLNPAGTAFQKSVWAAMSQIGYGDTASYGGLAEKIGNPKACRAVGGAANKNPIAIVVPCHRVVGADGALVGFAAGTKLKAELLETEKPKR